MRPDLDMKLCFMLFLCQTQQNFPSQTASDVSNEVDRFPILWLSSINTLPDLRVPDAIWIAVSSTMLCMNASQKLSSSTEFFFQTIVLSWRFIAFVLQKLNYPGSPETIVSIIMHTIFLRPFDMAVNVSIKPEYCSSICLSKWFPHRSEPRRNSTFGREIHLQSS